MADLRDRLVGELTALIDASAVTGHEAALADTLETRWSATHEVVRVGDSLVVGRPTGARPCVALVGHLDVVPPTDEDRTARRRTVDDVDVVTGRGASDMHGGNAVALVLFEDHPDDAPVDVVLVLYAREEGPADANELEDVLDAVSWLTSDVDAAVVLEPTDGEVQAGCLGGLHAALTFHGRQAHSARPWHGRNAVTAAGRFLAVLDDLEPAPVEVDGIVFHDVWSVTAASTRNARNVIPGTFVLNLNLRFAPSRSGDAAAEELRTRVAAWATEHSDVPVTVEVTDVAHPGPPALDHPLVARLLSLTGRPATGKQAWTDVARFAARGVAAVNYGPGLTPQAHQRGEFVPVDALVDGHELLARFLRDG